MYSGRTEHMFTSFIWRGSISGEREPTILKVKTQYSDHVASFMILLEWPYSQNSSLGHAHKTYHILRDRILNDGCIQPNDAGNSLVVVLL